MAERQPYNPGIVPESLDPALVRYLDDELNRLADTVGATGFPVGGIVAWAVEALPSGAWLRCDGLGHPVAAYPALFAALGYSYGGAGATFNVPDYRGEFLRGTDRARGADPDAAARTDRGDGTLGDNVGTRQLSLFGSHTHTGPSHTHTGGTHTHAGRGNQLQWRVAGDGNVGIPAGLNTLAPVTLANAAGGAVATTPAGTGPTGPAGGAESRGRNVNVQWIILAA